MKWLIFFGWVVLAFLLAAGIATPILWHAYGLDRLTTTDDADVTAGAMLAFVCFMQSAAIGAAAALFTGLSLLLRRYVISKRPPRFGQTTSSL
jgi:hypothetical protein